MPDVAGEGEIVSALSAAHGALVEGGVKLWAPQAKSGSTASTTAAEQHHCSCPTRAHWAPTAHAILTRSAFAERLLPHPHHPGAFRLSQANGMNGGMGRRGPFHVRRSAFCQVSAARLSAASTHETG